MLEINQIGYNFSENNKFTINRPKGAGDYLLLYFVNEVDVFINEDMVTIQPFSVLIFSPDYPQYYTNSRTGFINDWIHFSKQYKKTYGISPGNSRTVSMD